MLFFTTYYVFMIQPSLLISPSSQSEGLLSPQPNLLHTNAKSTRLKIICLSHATLLKVIKKLWKINSFTRIADELDYENILMLTLRISFSLFVKNLYLSSFAILQILFNFMNMDWVHKINTRCNGKLLLIQLLLIQFYKTNIFFLLFPRSQLGFLHLLYSKLTSVCCHFKICLDIFKIMSQQASAYKNFDLEIVFPLENCFHPGNYTMQNCFPLNFTHWTEL